MRHGTVLKILSLLILNALFSGCAQLAWTSPSIVTPGSSTGALVGTPAQPVPTYPTHTAFLLPTPTPTAVLTNSGKILHLPVMLSQKSATLIGAGDVSDCSYNGSQMTAKLLARYPQAAIFTAGDNVHHDGHLENYIKCLDPTWGKYKARIHPAIGNHEYDDAKGAAPYFKYFGAAAGKPGQGYYSYDLGEWHIVVLNSSLPYEHGSPMEAWLTEDLKAHPALCTLAYWHFPRFSNGKEGSYTSVDQLWRDLYQAGVDVVINGHNHDYERFAPQDQDGNADDKRGVREFVVGTGGGSLEMLKGEILPNTEVTLVGVYGVIKLELNPESYTWEFLSAETGKPLDSGINGCHP